MAALEVLRVVKDAAVTLPVHLEAIDFTDTEGFIIELLGSSALAGRFNNLDGTLGGEQEFLARLTEVGLKKDELLRARRNPDLLAGFIELHVEQGNRLFDAGHKVRSLRSSLGIFVSNLLLPGVALLFFEEQLSYGRHDAQNIAVIG